MLHAHASGESPCMEPATHSNRTCSRSSSSNTSSRTTTSSNSITSSRTTNRQYRCNRLYPWRLRRHRLRHRSYHQVDHASAQSMRVHTSDTRCADAHLHLVIHAHMQHAHMHTCTRPRTPTFTHPHKHTRACMNVYILAYSDRKRCSHETSMRESARKSEGARERECESAIKCAR